MNKKKKEHKERLKKRAKKWKQFAKEQGFINDLFLMSAITRKKKQINNLAE